MKSNYPIIPFNISRIAKPVGRQILGFASPRVTVVSVRPGRDRSGKEIVCLPKFTREHADCLSCKTESNLWHPECQQVRKQ